MEIVFMLFMILGAIAVMVICVVDIIDNAGNVYQQILPAVLFLLMCASIVACALGIREEIIHHEDRYSSKEYRIETEIITRGEQSDTTYVIVKK